LKIAKLEKEMANESSLKAEKTKELNDFEKNKSKNTQNNSTE
jgi:hypothetical protein